jgi:hypothetical protein
MLQNRQTNDSEPKGPGTFSPNGSKLKVGSKAAVVRQAAFLTSMRRLFRHSQLI